MRLMRKNGNKFILALSLLVILGFLTVVYATLSTTLSIEGSGSIKKGPVEINNFINFVSAEKVNEYSSGNLSISDDKLTVIISNIKLTQSEKQVVYKVTVKNVYKDEATTYGKDAYLKSINTPMKLNDENVKVEVKHAEWGTEIKGYDKNYSGYCFLASGQEQIWNVIVSYVGDNLGNADIQPFTIKTEWTDTNS